ncbi:hypothetical protein A2303_02210 [Candidatus Falkowbacteria bacterium RIFOXYB2_FULL_47_14]|uniref:Oxidized purine nucleoside triphosphate hydrolase n=1 Tax=Candidatus Falkowbacteria bacterium RIFOXYA2_FULL_47_19 TaxID=1797994 RepID=A0A1F5SF13_9BACT|nr:MAG: hypothetical protein A2227_07385 [Candidatus Falkowbacteria bacterium RIFOXYA2_FULL_47_19]OGF35282.1 MAG: hypothetical protein A2468_01010 [Candidatus Falkowbacteria bacterium RIFOXYC2_FULL_46_15]OGF43949.1 MAG: hypothetical protein A2303_02210 [Candidatus Falkowbacteria bacterium RIFOXYB2_FULL_47_14]
MPQLRNATLVFLIKRSGDKIDRVCLAMKKRGFGVNRWNGVGGKLNPGESIEEAAVRETEEEIGVRVRDLDKRAILEFCFPHNPDWDQAVHVFFAEKWEGEPSESEEMRPEWFEVSELPFSEMWPDDEFWVPAVMNGKLVKAVFRFGEGDVILDKTVTVVDKLLG